MIVHVATQGARIVREGRHLLVRKGDDTHHTLFPYRLEQLLIYGNVAITPQALSLLMQQNVDLVFLRLDGRYKGRLEGQEPRNVFLRKRQFALCDDLEFRMTVARDIVRGKLLNMATLLMRIKRARKAHKAGHAADAVRRQAESLQQARGLDSLRGMEGAASRRYFEALGTGFIKDQGFTKRVRRPPTDPVNSVLSLLYTFCINRCYAAVRQAGLDPAPGALHDLEYGRNSLPLDLVEEFRPIVADALTLSLFNLGVVDKENFIELRPQPAAPETRNAVDAASKDPLHSIELPQEDEIFDQPEQPLPDSQTPADGKFPLRLQPAAFKRVANAFEKKMDDEFYHPVAESTMNYNQALIFQARLYRRVVEGEAASYYPLLLR